METDLMQIVSFSVSLLSLCVAVGTFISQRKTEKNTKPLMTQKTHEFLLKMQQLRILDSYIKLTAIKRILVEHEFMMYPSDAIMVSTKIPLDTIHAEMFYNTPKVYQNLRGLYEKTEQYNIFTDDLINHLEKPSTESEIISSELIRLLARNESLCQGWYKFMSITYGHGHNGKKSFIEDLAEESVDSDNKSTCTDGGKGDFCSDKNKFINFIEDESKRKVLINYINGHAWQYYKQYSQIMMPRK